MKKYISGWIVLLAWVMAPPTVLLVIPERLGFIDTTKSIESGWLFAYVCFSIFAILMNFLFIAKWLENNKRR